MDERIRLSDRPELLGAAADWFHEKWGVPREAYAESMTAALSSAGVPEWYLALAGGRIAGGLGVIENDFHPRRDLRPNVCAVYTEPEFRRRGIAGALLELAVTDQHRRGTDTLYLLTDHDSFYERYGWHYLCPVRGDGEDRDARMYVHHVLETDRLLLRPWRWGDAEILFRWASDPAVGPAAGWKPHTSVENSREILRTVLSAPGTYAVVLKATGEPVGSAGLTVAGPDTLAPGPEEAEIGYWLARPFWGQGLIPEAVRALTDYAFGTLGLRTLRCGYFEGNEKSRRVQEKCGFVYECTRKDILWPATGEIRTEHVTRLDRETWRDSR